RWSRQPGPIRVRFNTFAPEFNMKAFPKALLLALTLSTPLVHAGASVEVSTPPAPPSAEEVRAGKLKAAVDGFWRDSANKSRDRYRHPTLTLEFFDVRPDMRVLEITPGGGWYTEILAPYLRDEGHYAGAMMDPGSVDNEQRAAFYQRQWEDLDAKLKDDPE